MWNKERGHYVTQVQRTEGAAAPGAPEGFLEQRSKLGWEGPQAGVANTWGR